MSSHAKPLCGTPKIRHGQLADRLRDLQTECCQKHNLLKTPIDWFRPYIITPLPFAARSCSEDQVHPPLCVNSYEARLMPSAGTTLIANLSDTYAASPRSSLSFFLTLWQVFLTQFQQDVSPGQCRTRPAC